MLFESRLLDARTAVQRLTTYKLIRSFTEIIRIIYTWTREPSAISLIKRHIKSEEHDVTGNLSGTFIWLFVRNCNISFSLIRRKIWLFRLLVGFENRVKRKVLYSIKPKSPVIIITSLNKSTAFTVSHWRRSWSFEQLKLINYFESNGETRFTGLYEE